MKAAVKIIILFLIGTQLLMFNLQTNIERRILHISNENFKQALENTMILWQENKIKSDDLLDTVIECYPSFYKNIHYQFILCSYIEKPKMIKVKMNLNWNDKSYSFEEVLIEEVVYAEK